MMVEPRTFLANVYRLYEAQETDLAIDAIFRWVDTIMKAGEHGICDSMLRLVDVTRLDEDVLVGFLCSTATSAKLLPSRELFITKVRAHIAKDVGAEEAATLVELLESLAL